MNLFRTRRSGGVTLVELLCVIAIIAILAALMLGPVFKALAHAKKVLGGN
jgi:prepilin-type N-terminal cleavage/methylation domain-containing protein